MSAFLIVFAIVVYGVGGFMVFMYQTMDKLESVSTSGIKAVAWPLFVVRAGLRQILPSEEKRLRKRLATAQRELRLLDLRHKVESVEREYAKALDNLLDNLLSE